MSWYQPVCPFNNKPEEMSYYVIYTNYHSGYSELNVCICGYELLYKGNFMT